MRLALLTLLAAGCAAPVPDSPEPEAFLVSLRAAVETGDPEALAALVQFPLDHVDRAYLPPPPPVPSALAAADFSDSRLSKLLTGDAMRETLADPPSDLVVPAGGGHRFHVVLPMRVRRYGTTLPFSVTLDLAGDGTGGLRVIRSRVEEG